MKKTKTNIKKILEELKRVPIIQVACEKSGISRNTFYKWKQIDKEFAAQVEKAMIEGESFVNDMSESQLLQLIKEKEFNAIRFWLNKRHPKFKDKIEIEGNLNTIQELSPEQKKLVEKALELSAINFKQNGNR